MALIAAAGAVGLLLSQGLPGGAGTLAGLASASIAAAGVVLRARAYMARRPRLLELCRSCGDPVAWPRRTSYTCRVGETIVCYNYALDRFYAYRVRGAAERLPPYRGLDYYCVKMLGGRARRRGRLVLYRGRIEALSHRRGWLLRGEARLAYGPGAVGLGEVLRGVEEA